MNRVVIIFTLGTAISLGGVAYAMRTKGTLRSINAVWLMAIGTICATLSLGFMGKHATDFPTIPPFLITVTGALLTMALFVSAAALLKDRRDRAARHGEA